MSYQASARNVKVTIFWLFNLFLSLKVRKTIHWIIPNCTKELAERKKPGKSIVSKEFFLWVDHNKTVWWDDNFIPWDLSFWMCFLNRVIRCFPNGQDENGKGSISVFLWLKSANNKLFKAIWNVGIVAKSGAIWSYIKYFENKWGCWRLIWNRVWFPQIHWAYEIVHAKFWFYFGRKVDNRLRGEEKLKKIKELNVYLAKQFSLQISLSWSKVNPLQDEISPDFKNLFNSEVLSDFVIKVAGGQELKVHKAIFIARSPVFLRMLNNNIAPQRSVDIQEYSSKTV